MKKKLSVLIAICAFSMFALTACADDTVDEGDSVDVNPTISAVTGDGANDTLTPNP